MWRINFAKLRKFLLKFDICDFCRSSQFCASKIFPMAVSVPKAGKPIQFLKVINEFQVLNAVMIQHHGSTIWQIIIHCQNLELLLLNHLLIYEKVWSVLRPIFHYIDYNNKELYYLSFCRLTLVKMVALSPCQ